MPINIPSLLLGASPLVAGIILKQIMDMQIWPKLITWLNWVPLRSIFRDNPPNLRGEWDVYWECASPNFSDPQDRKKSAKIFQVANYCYADYSALDSRYCLYGKIEGGHLTGVWFNPKDAHGYRGAFQLRIVSANQLEGRWLGFSKTSLEIRTDEYSWSKNPS